MGIRKNARFLSPTEKENFVKACVLMNADIINLAAPVASQYSRWAQYVAIHRMIQSGFAPGIAFVNFGHGGNGAYSFLSWHRYFLYQFEQQLQVYVPGVMLPYWDWTDPASIMTDDFLGPNGDSLSGNVVQRGYFAFDKPGVGNNTTTLPGWWPANLNGWRMPSMFPAFFQGGLQRVLNAPANLPPSNDIDIVMSKITYPDFQLVLEAGDLTNINPALRTATQMHNELHGWVGGHMSSTSVSPFDPIFYMHHCNIDRLWAMWQMDGHETVYPAVGGTNGHRRDQIMYPWTGGAAGYGTTASISSSIPMPDFSAVGAKTNADTLDFRNAFGYSYDSLAIIGVGLDQTGSMNGLTPDPMTVGAPDVSKWEAAKRGVSAFLQDCEALQSSRITYIMGGVKTFRRTIANNFVNVFGVPGYGLIKTGTSFSKATFDTNIVTMSPGGSTPLADALQDIQTTLVEPPNAGLPADEQRYLAMLTDGILTSGSPMSSIPDGSFTRTAIFAMGFGTGADVDYGTLASLVAKGKNLGFTQTFHGENAGTIDKFYFNSLAAAIGFDPIIDPLVELFAGEHTHIFYHSTSADESFMITAQGMDFIDEHWTFQLHGPDGTIHYGEIAGHDHAHSCNHCCPAPYVTVKRGDGRLSLVLQRNNSPYSCWVGKWTLMIAYKMNNLSKMFMPELGELLFPVSAGPIRGSRYSRLLTNPKQRIATRNIVQKSLHSLDTMSVGTNSNNNEACSMIVNISARTNLKLNLVSQDAVINAGKELKVNINDTTSNGAILNLKSFARLIAPALDISKKITKNAKNEIIKNESRKYSAKNDIALMLAKIEKEKRSLRFTIDKEIKTVSHDHGTVHMHEKDTKIPGVYHLGVYIEGLYCPEMKSGDGHGNHDDHGGKTKSVSHKEEDCSYEPFTRILNLSVAVK